MLLATPHFPFIVIDNFLRNESFFCLLANHHLNDVILEGTPAALRKITFVSLADLEGVVSCLRDGERVHLAVFVVLFMRNAAVTIFILHLT